MKPRSENLILWPFLILGAVSLAVSLNLAVLFILLGSMALALIRRK